MKWLSLCRARALSLSLAFSAIGCGQSEDGIVRAAYVPAGYYLPFLVMKEQNLLQRKGYTLKLEQFSNNSEMVSAFLNGRLDVTAQSSFTMLPVCEDHPGAIKFVYGQYMKSYSFIASKEQAVHGIADLANRDIATWQSPTAANLIPLLFEEAGVQVPPATLDTRIKPYGARDWPNELMNGNVTVGFGFDVPLARLEASGRFMRVEPDAVERLLVREGGYLVFNGGGFVSARLIASAPKKAAAIREALLESIDTIRSDNLLAREILARALGEDTAIVKEASLDEFVSPNPGLFDAATKTADLLLRRGLLRKRVTNAGELFWLGSR